MTRVQFREDDETVAFVEGLGLNPNDVARSAFEAEVRRLRARAKFEKLRGHRAKLAAGEAAKLVREGRDSR